MATYILQEELDKLSNRAFNVDGTIYCITKITIVEPEDIPICYKMSGFALNSKYPKFSRRINTIEFNSFLIRRMLEGRHRGEVDYVESVKVCLGHIEKNILSGIKDLNIALEECRNDIIEFNNKK